MPKTFVTLGQNNIVLPSNPADPTGMSSYHVTSDTIFVEASPVPTPPNLRDIVRVGLCGVELANHRCLRHKYWVNDAASRWMINVLIINQNGIDAAPGDLHFVIRQSSSCIPTVRYDGIWSPSQAGAGGWLENGLLVQIGGLLSTSVEVQAEIVPTLGTPVPSGYSIVFEFIFDRLGDNNQAIRGPLVTPTPGLLPPFP